MNVESVVSVIRPVATDTNGYLDKLYVSHTSAVETYLHTSCKCS